MNSSGIKKGLAATAVASMAVLCTPSFASAQPVLAAGDAGTYLVVGETTGGQTLSVKPNSITAGQLQLVAYANTSARVQFSYRPAGGGAFTNLGSPVTPDAEGLFRYSWSVPVALIGTAVDVQAVQVDANLATLPGTSSIVPNETISGNADSAALGAIAGGLGVWQTSTNAGALDWQGSVSGASTASSVTVDAATYVPGAGANTSATVANGSFTGIADLGAYPFGGTADEKLVAVNTTAGQQDAHKYTVYKQTLASVTAVANPSAVQVGQQTKITVTVKDQKGQPVVGARVFSFDPSAAAPQTGTYVGTTDATGKYVDTQTPATAPKTYNYYVESDSTETSPKFDSGLDYPVSVTVGASSASAAGASSKLGQAFDIDEAADMSATGNFSETVKDQAGNPVQGKNVFYRWVYTPFNPTAVDKARTIDNGGVDFTGTTDATGKIPLTFPTLNTTNTRGGTFALQGYVKTTTSAPGQQAGDLVLDAYSVKVGESKIVWTTDNSTGVSQRQSQQTTQALTGTLELADGTPLAGDLVNILWTPTSSDATFAPQSAQPAGTQRQSDTQAQVRTDANGQFGVVLTDPAATNHPILESGTLSATGSAGDGAAFEPFNNGVGIDSTGSETVQLLNSLAPASITLNDNGAGVHPGENDGVTATVLNADSLPLITTVTLNANGHGYFDDSTAVKGGLTGVFTPLASNTLKTNAAGQASAGYSIKQDAGFDDDGVVAATVTATSGSASKTVSHQWNTLANPLNLLPGNVKLSFSADQSQEAASMPAGFTRGGDGVTSLPSAAGNRYVHLDAVVLDQFGNRTAGTVDHTNVPAATAVGGDFSGQFTDESAHLYAWDGSSERTNDQLITISESGSVNNVSSTGAVTSTATTESSNKTINWYAIDWAASTYTLTHNTADSDPVNTTVTETYKAVDQKGNPIVGLTVNFYRGGPDKNQNGDVNSSAFSTTTDQNGNAFYVFKGVAAGLASITAVPADQNGNPLTVAQRDDTVTFTGASTGGQKAITAHLVVRNASDGNDKVYVSAPAAPGATITVYQQVSGVYHIIRTARLNAAGYYAFGAFDPRKGSNNAYRVRVSATPTTKATWSNIYTAR